MIVDVKDALCFPWVRQLRVDLVAGGASDRTLRSFDNGWVDILNPGEVILDTSERDEIMRRYNKYRTLCHQYGEKHPVPIAFKRTYIDDHEKGG